MRFFYLVWSNLKRKKVRTLLTMLSIMVAFVLFGYLAAIKQGLSQGVDVAGADRLIVRDKVSIIQTMPESHKVRIAEIPGVELVTHATWFGGEYQDPRNFFARMPVEPAEYLEMYPEFLLDEAQKANWLATRTGAIVGRSTADRFGWNIGDKIPLQADIWPRENNQRTWEFDLVGIYEGAEKGTDATQFLFHYDYFEEARVLGKGEVGWYMVRVDDPERSAEVAEAIDRKFANSPHETKSEAEGAFLQGFAEQIGNIGLILILILTAVFFTMMLVAGNTMAQTVRERTQELAVLKAVGFTDRGVLLLVLAESGVLAGLSGLSGLGLAWLLISFGDPTGGSLPTFFLPTRDLLIGLVFVAALGLATGLFPALSAMRLRIADALRR